MTLAGTLTDGGCTLIVNNIPITYPATRINFAAPMDFSFETNNFQNGAQSFVGQGSSSFWNITVTE